MNKYKLINVSLFILSVIVLATMLMYLEFVCKSGGCSYDLRNVYLRPLTQVGLVLSSIFGILLFIPSHYFEKWLKWLFTWLFPLYLMLIYILGDTSGQIISFPYELVAQLLGYIFGGISLVFTFIHFVHFHYFKKKK